MKEILFLKCKNWTETCGVSLARMQRWFPKLLSRWIRRMKPWTKGVTGKDGIYWETSTDSNMGRGRETHQVPLKVYKCCSSLCPDIPIWLVTRAASELRPQGRFPSSSPFSFSIPLGLPLPSLNEWLPFLYFVNLYLLQLPYSVSVCLLQLPYSVGIYFLQLPFSVIVYLLQLPYCVIVCLLAALSFVALWFSSWTP